MFKTLRRAGGMAIVAAAAPVLLSAQATRPMAGGVPSPTAAASAEARGWYAELQRITARLQTVHNEALKDNELRSQQQALFESIRVAMLRSDSRLDSLESRVVAMRREAATAQQRGDQARLRALRQELAQIQTRVMNVQKAVMQQPAIVQRTQEFEGRLRGRMLQLEPQTDQLLERARELQGRLLRATQQRPGTATTPSRTGPVRSGPVRP